MKRALAHTPPISFHDILLPCCGAIPKYDTISIVKQKRLEFLEMAEKLYDD